MPAVGAAHLWVLIAVSVVTLAVLAATSSGLWFYNDEWDMINDRGLDVDSLLRPHNEHFSAVLVVIYRSLISLFGTTSYAPFLVALWATHLFAAASVYVLLREDGTPWQATAGTVIFLAPGVGAHNLFTAFQIGFLLATALGCLALAVSPRRPGIAAVLLTIAVATQGVGLFYWIATVVRLSGRRSLVWLLLPVSVFAMWLLLFGRSSVGASPPAELTALPAYVLYGLASSFGQGDPRLGAIVVALVVVSIRSRSRDPLVIAAAFGLLSMFITTGLVRAQLGFAQAGASRYYTVALPFVLLIVLAAWRSARERYPVGRIGIPLVAIAVALGFTFFVTFREWWGPLLASDPLR